MTFRYNGSQTPVLCGVSLHIRPGEFVALAGPSGAGKSTLLRLLTGLETTHQGSIRYDGVSLDELDINAVRAQLGVILQEDRVSVTTIRHNIAGSAPYRLDQVWQAAQRAALDRDIFAMPMGIQTILEVGRISSGQQQRVFLAAKILRELRVLMLDEATSALNEDLEREIFQNLKSLGLTCVFAAHRASTLRYADRVYVLESGRIVQSGLPRDLWAQRDGPLARLHIPSPECTWEAENKS